MSLTSYDLFNIWFPGLVGALVIGLIVAALWDFVRSRFWLFVSRFLPGILKEVGLDSRHQSRAEAEDHHREISEKLNIFARVMNLLVSPKSSNSGATAAFDIEAQTEINPHHATPAIRMIGASAVEGTYSISTSSENHIYSGETFQGIDCRPINIIFTSFFPDGTPKDVTRPAKRLYKRHANGRVKRMKSSIILQASIVIDPWVLAEIVELAKHCMQKEHGCIFQLGNWAVLYYNAGEVLLHLLKEGDVPVNVEARWQDGKTGITMRGLYLTGSQVKVGTKRTSKILRSSGPATQGAGDLDKLYLPTGELYVPGEDSLIYASKVVVVDGVSVIVRSEASYILPPREKNALIEAVWTRWLRISNSAKKMLLSLMFRAEDCQPELAENRPEFEFDPEQLELSVEHWKGLSEIELLNTRKEVLRYLHEQRASGIIKRARLPSPHSHLIFVRDEHYLEYWQEGLRVLNEVIHRNSSDSHSHTHIRVRGGIQFLIGDLESALQDYDLAHLNTGAHQSTVLLERALVKCKLERYTEAMHDVVAVITLNPNVNDIQELQTCIQLILDQQRSFRIVTQSGPLCQRPLLPDQENSMVEIPDLLTGDEWHSGKIGSLRPVSDAGTAGGSAFDPQSKSAKSTGVARAADWSMTSIAEALKLQLKLTNRAESLERKPRYHARRISWIVNILEDECDPDDVLKPLSTEDQEMLHWQAPTEDLQDDLRVRNDLSSLSGRLCPYKNISHAFCDKVTAGDGHEQKRGPLPLSSYRHVSFRSAMLTKHSAADGDVQTLFLYDGTPGDRSCWRRRSPDYIKELVISEARSPYRAFWLVQWDVVDMWHVLQGDPDRGLCSNPAAVERQDDLRKFHSFRSPWIAEVAAAGTSSPTPDGNGLNRHRGSDARTSSRMSIPVHEKPQTSRHTQPLRASGVDSVFPTFSEKSTSGGDSTVDSSSMNAYDWKPVDNFDCHNGDEEAVSEVLRSASAHRTHRPEHYYWLAPSDFGPGKSLIQSSDGETPMAGTRRYMAPEVREVREFQRKADVYSFAMTCYEIVTGELPIKEYQNHDTWCTLDTGSDARTNPRISMAANYKPRTWCQILPRPGREPGTSQFYGVRFRPDLQKWVAEIRVANWKAVDKKVWLGTFDTKQAAARAVDLARKLLKCSKKHPPNLPCEKLEAYSTTILPHLVLTDFTMHNEITLFIKRECKLYAASFDDTPSEQIIPAFNQQDSFGGQFLKPTSSVNPAGQGYENMAPPNSSHVINVDVHSESDFSDMILEPYTGYLEKSREGARKLEHPDESDLASTEFPIEVHDLVKKEAHIEVHGLHKIVKLGCLNN